MTPIEQAIRDTIARMQREDMGALRAVYLRPQDIDQLGGADEIAGVPIKHCSERGRPMIYNKSGVARAIDLSNVPDPFTPTERLVLVSLLQGWPCSPSAWIRNRLRRRGLVAVRKAPRRHRGRDCHVEEPRLTGRGEQQAKAIRDGLTRDERADLHAAALRSGL